MFTGIITDIGRIATVEHRAGHDLRLAIETGYDLETVAIGASIACSGVCLTVTSKQGSRFTVDVSAESVSRTAAAMWAEGARLNLERALKVGDELGGHIVTGHVDGIGTVEVAAPVEGSIHIAIRAPAKLAPMIAPKGSIAVDGVSLTVNAVDDAPDGSALFHLNIIPHTAEWTTLGALRPGTEVNLEIDVLARYLQRMQQARTS
jgi:riboflavin synthase